VPSREELCSGTPVAALLASPLAMPLHVARDKAGLDNLQCFRRFASVPFFFLPIPFFFLRLLSLRLKLVHTALNRSIERLIHTSTYSLYVSIRGGMIAWPNSSCLPALGFRETHAIELVDRDDDEEHPSR
jgi:hypothetical protein